MSFEEPTYEEFKKATAFARLKYKYGLFITILCLIGFILLIVFIIYYVDELKTNPLTYAAEKFDVECRCTNFEKGINIFVSSEGINNVVESTQYPLLQFDVGGKQE